MRRRQGHSFTEYEVHRIVRLLRSSELSMPEIAGVIGCARSSVTKINARYGIREYGKRRTSWEHDSKISSCSP
jgi:hypothetical protein